MQAYHNDPNVKKTYIARIRAHRKADLLMQSKTGNPADGQKGCAVACTMNGYSHVRYESELGIPEELARLEDRLFELMPWNDPDAEMDAQRWPEAFLSAIKPGADLSKIAGQFKRGVALEAVLAHWPEGMYERQEGDRELIVNYLFTGDEELRKDARDAAYAAYAAAADAADAAYAAAADADAAAYAAAADAADAAAADAAAADAAAREKARHEHAQYMALRLLDLLRKAPVTA